MDVTSQGRSPEGGANKNQSECICSQPTANGTLPHHKTDEAEAPPPLPSDRPEEGDDSPTSDVARLLPAPPSPSAPPPQQGTDDASSSSPPPVGAPPPPAPICSPPPPPLHHHHQPLTNQKRLSSAKSHASFKTDAHHIEEVTGDDCCADCLLACLFCKLRSMCSAVGGALSCGGGACCCESLIGCWCCVETLGEACTEEACQAVLECGVMEDCCGSSDCLEVCLECCSICFPT